MAKAATGKSETKAPKAKAKAKAPKVKKPKAPTSPTNGERGKYRVCVSVLCGTCAAELACPTNRVDTKSEAGKYAQAAGWGKSAEHGYHCPACAKFYG